MSDPTSEQSIFDKLLNPAELPTKADNLFTSQEDWWNNACINWSTGGWSLYAVGYKEAADLLVASVEQRAGGQDTLVYPALFLYRQYLELEIKDTLRMARHLQGVADKFPMHHRISDLWKELHKLLLEISPNDSVEELRQIARLVDEFAKVDPISMAFRYPIDTSGNPSLLGMTLINLRNVRDVIAKISVILGGANSQVYEYLQLQLQQEREFRDDCY